MAHITSFKIEGLAGRKEPFSADLNRDLNIFYGLNGSGKTSLLKILHSAMVKNSNILINVPFKSAVVNIFSINYNKIFEYRIKKNKLRGLEKIRALGGGITTSELQFLEMEGNSMMNNWTIVNPEMHDEELKSTTWAHRYLPTSRLYLGTSKIADKVEYEQKMLSDEQLDTFFSTTLEKLWIEYNSEVLEVIRQAQEKGLANILKDVLGTTKSKKMTSDLNLEDAYKRVKSFLTRQGSPQILKKFENFQKLYSRRGQLRVIVGDINTVEMKIENALQPRNDLQGLINSAFTGNKNVSLNEKSIEVKTNDNEDIGLKSLSSGEKQYLRILIENLLAGSNSLIIDEPEISMHVDWQKSLLNSLQLLNRDAQIIVATHSPEILADFPESKIFNV